MRSLLLAFAVLALAAVSPAAAQSVAGEWNASMNTPGGPRAFKVILQVAGDSLTGTVKRASGDVPLRGSRKGNDVTFSYTIDYGGNALELTVTATVTGDEMKGSIDLGGNAKEEFSAKRAGAPPASDR
jgi:hypothetical protein